MLNLYLIILPANGSSEPADRAAAVLPTIESLSGLNRRIDHLVTSTFYVSLWIAKLGLRFCLANSINTYSRLVIIFVWGRGILNLKILLIEFVIPNQNFFRRLKLIFDNKINFLICGCVLRNSQRVFCSQKYGIKG